jgi:hypothetical protein
MSKQQRHPPSTLEDALKVLTSISEAVTDCELYLEDETVSKIEDILRQAGLLP